MLSISSSSSSEPSSSSSSATRSRKKPAASGPPAETKWRTGAQQRAYGRRLLAALRAARARAGAGAAAPLGARAVKEAADSALALTAGGQSRWSRAVLLARRRKPLLLKSSAGKLRRRRRRRLPPPPPAPSPAKPKVKERLRLLGRLVPGCRKLPAPSLLEETADYVAALEMQVKAMRALADALSAAALSPPPDGAVEDPRG
ncbi:Transcription factor bHLH148 [Ananas comosus]|uniref:Transcription factor bHLH148 n=1 Tax=Ananas comosus TaxID=4615 RepID=A0A199W4J9_ANACO|nr:Transcription factor bHLH148 [Ananas comosus]